MISFDSSPSVTNSTFSGNSARFGGGVYNEGRSDSPMFANVFFSGNTASTDGGGMYNDDAYPNLINVTFSGNTASDDGGAIMLSSVEDDTPVVVRNSVFWGNTASGDGNQIYLSGSTEALLIAHSLVQGGVPRGAVNGGNNLDDNPLFIDANGADNLIGTPDDNARLQSGSPAINVGDNEALSADEQDLDGDGDTTERLPLDLDGEARIQSATVDIGTYESGRS